MKRWFKYVKPYLSSFILGPLGMIVEVIGEMFMPLILAKIINDGEKMMNGEAGALTVGTSIGYAGILVGIVLLMMAGGVAGAYFGSKASVNFAADLRRDVYEKIQKFSEQAEDMFGLYIDTIHLERADCMFNRNWKVDMKISKISK